MNKNNTNTILNEYSPRTKYYALAPPAKTTAGCCNNRNSGSKLRKNTK